LGTLTPLDGTGGSRLQLSLVTKGCRYSSRRLIINNLINIGHNAVSHQLLNDLYGTNLQKVSQLPHT
jgi:hypothetical protein